MVLINLARLVQKETKRHQECTPEMNVCSIHLPAGTIRLVYKYREPLQARRVTRRGDMTAWIQTLVWICKMT
jgi:hypothetical protein